MLGKKSRSLSLTQWALFVATEIYLTMKASLARLDSSGESTHADQHKIYHSREYAQRL